MKKRLACILMILVILSLTGCGLLKDLSAGSQTASMYLEGFMDAIIAGDEAQAYALFEPESADPDDFAQAFKRISDYFGSHTGYTYKQTSVNISTHNGDKQTTAHYTLVTDDDRAYLVSLLLYEGADGSRGLYKFNIVEQEEYAVATSPTGTFAHMKGADPIQWIFLGLAVAGYGFSIWMLVDCIRHRIKHKWLWIILILLGYAGFAYTAQAGSTRLNFSLLPMTYSHILLYPGGGIQIVLSLPLGTFIYCLLRRNLYVKDEPAAVGISEPPDMAMESPSKEPTIDENQSETGDLASINNPPLQKPKSETYNERE